MAEEDLAALENQGLKKKFNLTSAINLSNMVSSILINISLSVNSKINTSEPDLGPVVRSPFSLNGR